MSVLTVNLGIGQFDNPTLDKTAGEIAAAYPLVVISDTQTEDEEYLSSITQISIVGGVYEFTDSTGGTYRAQSSSAYPELSV